MNKLPEHFVNTVEGYVDLNMLETAADECLSMVGRYPDNAELLVYSAGKVSMGTPQQINQLLAPINKYLQQHPDALPVREVLAVLLSIVKRYDESLEEFSKVPPEKRRHDANWVWFKTLIVSGATNKALHWIRTVWPKYSHKVRSADPDAYIKWLWDVSVCLSEAGECEEAERGYKFLLKNDPGAIGVYLDYGKLLARTKRKEEAVSILRQGMRLTWKEIDDQRTYPGVIGYCLNERRQIENEINEELKKLQPSAGG